MQREASGDGFSEADRLKRVDLCARSLALNEGRLIVYGEFPTQCARPAAPTESSMIVLAKRKPCPADAPQGIPS